MVYKTYSTQVAEHLNFLKMKGFDVENLVIDPSIKEIRCRLISTKRGRGELSYRCTTRKLNNGLLGIGTWCRGLYGKEDNFQTYGLWPDGVDPVTVVSTINQNQPNNSCCFDLAARKAYGFWMYSSLTGRSDYLDNKNVGYYGLRFRSGEYGNIAVVPMRDESNRLWSYQLLNSDGSKRFAKGAKTLGLQHVLGEIINSKPIGIAESYVTAATCQELTGLKTVCAFSSENLIHVSKKMRKKYPESYIYILADNDRHLYKNIGIMKAQEACQAIKEKVAVVVPEFGDVPPHKAASDWNDLVRIQGIIEAKHQLNTLLEGG